MLTLSLLILVLLTAHTAHAARISPGRERTVLLLNRGLAHLPMRGTGRELEAAGHKWGVSPFFIIGVAGKESWSGRRSCRNNPRNIWGLKSCQTGSYVDLNGDGSIEDLPLFRTWAGAYDFFARYIRARQPHARTPWDVHGYCECNEREWAATVAEVMRRLFGVKAEVRYR